MLWQHSSFEFLNILRELTLNLQGNRTLAQLTTFQKYFKRTTGTLPKFILLVTHDEILNSYLEGLGYRTNLGAYPAAQLYIEYYNPANSTEIRVRTTYKQRLEDTEVAIRLPN